MLASRRHEKQRRRKTAGNISDGLRCSPWRRAETPGKLTHHIGGGDTHGDGSSALVHPSKIASRQPEKLAALKELAYLGPKLCYFLQDFHPDWIARMQLPKSDRGEHNHLKKHHFDRILRRLQSSSPGARTKHHREIFFQVFHRLEIGHSDYLGNQFAYSSPFKSASKSRKDFVFFIPPPPFYTGLRSDFDLSLDNAWYGSISLILKLHVRQDSGKIREVECAMINVLYDYAEGR